MKKDHTILYVEDEPNDVVMLQFALEKAKISNPLKIVKNGEEALAYLSGTGKYADRFQHPMPDLILLDLKLPRISGLQVLEWLRAQPQLADIPVVIYTSAASPNDREKTRHLGATDFIVKPAGLDDTIAMAIKLKEQWLNLLETDP